MDPTIEIAQLLRWDGGDVVLETAYAAMLANPLFDTAARALDRNMLDAPIGDQALDAIFKDAGRYVAAMWAICLHVSGGLTLPRLKRAGAESGFLSAGRARDLLNYLQHLDYIQVVAPAGASTPAVYEPTPTLLLAWRRHLSVALEAACVAEPAARTVLDRFDEPDVWMSFARAHGESLLAVSSGAGASPYERVFLHRLAGSQIVFTLIMSGDGAEFPPQGPLPFSMSAAARRFGVSRAHVGRMFQDARNEGLVRQTPEGGLVLEEGTRAFLRYLYAAQLVHLLHAAARTFRVLGPADRSPIS